jgi:hypothetical protein
MRISICAAYSGFFITGLSGFKVAGLTLVATGDGSMFFVERSKDLQR